MTQNAFAQDQLAALLAKLVEATQAGTIRWAKTEYENWFRADFPSGSAKIGLEGAQSGLPHIPAPNRYYRFVVGDDAGLMLENVVAPEADPSSPYGDAMRELYKRARWSALKIDAKLDALIADVESGDAKPSPPPGASASSETLASLEQPERPDSV